MFFSLADAVAWGIQLFLKLHFGNLVWYIVIHGLKGLGTSNVAHFKQRQLHRADKKEHNDYII